ncbi:TetR/AcrR family transcriptional regulator [Nocardioides marmoraquaticus]
MARSSYHHGNLRAALVDEAVLVVRDRGPEDLSLRELARRIGVSHNAAYRHFAHRDDLVAAVGDHAMSELDAAMRREIGAVDVDDPVLAARLRLLGVGRAYVTFALAEPGLFRVAFTARAGDGSRHVSTETPYLMLESALDDLVEVGYLDPAARLGAEELCWSAMHGFALLVMADHVRVDEVDDHLARLLVAVDRSLGAPASPALPR